HGIKDALALEALDARYGRALRLEGATACGDHHHLRLEDLPFVGRHPEGAVLQAFEGAHHAVEGELRLKGLDLLHQPVHQFLAGDHRPCGNVVDRLFRVEFGALAARPVEDVDEVAFEIEQAELEHGEQAHRACPDDHHVRSGHLCHPRPTFSCDIGKDRCNVALRLTFGHRHHQPVQLVAHADLTGQPGIGPHVV